jgi:hypothetical protein
VNKSFHEKVPGRKARTSTCFCYGLMTSLNGKTLIFTYLVIGMSTVCAYGHVFINVGLTFHIKRHKFHMLIEEIFCFKML